MKSLTSSMLTSAAVLFVSVVSAAAQDSGRAAFESIGAPARPETQVRVQSNVNFFIAGPTGDGEESQKLRDRARRSVYEMAARECDVLRSVLAKDCRMESINVNVNGGRQFNQQQADGYNVNGAMNFQITLK